MVYLPLLARNVGSRFSGSVSDSMSHAQKALSCLENFIFTHEFYLTSAQILALNATPVTVLGAPGAGYAVIFLGATLYKPAGTAYAGVAGGEDLAFKYTDGSGLQVGSAETTGFLDQTTTQTRRVQPYRAASGVSEINPVANSPLVIQLLTGEITTGDTPLQIAIQYQVIKTDLSHIPTSATAG